MRFGVVIPTYNEAAFIGRTIHSLGRQVDTQGLPIDDGRLDVVVADTPGTDSTPEAAQEASASHPGLRLTVLSEPEPSMVAARISGIEHLLSRPSHAPDVLVSADADTVFPPTWLASIERLLASGRHDMVSTAGCFEHEFWLRCPTLSRRYVEHIGTIFFNTATADALVRRGDPPVFTPDLFTRFGRPVSDCGLAIRPELYRKLGGIRREYYDDALKRPILAVGWPLMFRAELAGERIAFMHTPEYETSARRLLHEPEALFSGASYLDEIEHFRALHGRHAWLEHFAERLDMRPLQRYVVKNYILQQCITRPERIGANPEYFGEAVTDISDAITSWRARNPDPGTREIFEFADQLADRYGDQVHSRAASVAMRGGRQ